MSGLNRVLVTGANGQLGWEMQQLASDYNNIEFKFYTRKELDITDGELVTSVVKSFNPNYIVNCAAYTAVDNAEDESKTAYNVNAKAVEYLSKSAAKVNATLIHISTDYVFDGNAKHFEFLLVK
ncbi:MAG: SDR family oxidoreductase [Bacteroidia bacterium]